MGAAALLVVMFVVCALNAAFPRQMWGLFKSWKYKNPEQVEPSDLVVGWYRISGVLGMMLLIGLGAYLAFGDTPERKRDRCEEILAKLSDVESDEPWLEAVQRRANQLGVEAEWVGGDFTGSIVVSEDGDRIGELRPGGGTSCG